MRISAFCGAVVASVVIGYPLSAAAQVDQQRAQEYFKDVQAVCEREGKRLWRMSMCGRRQGRVSFARLRTPPAPRMASCSMPRLPAGVFPRELRVTEDQKTLLLTNFNSKNLAVMDIARLPLEPTR
jgi:hypothetical protein